MYNIIISRYVSRHQPLHNYFYQKVAWCYLPLENLDCAEIPLKSKSPYWGQNLKSVKFYMHRPNEVFSATYITFGSRFPTTT